MAVASIEQARRGGAFDGALKALRTPAAVAAALSVYAGALHLYVTPEHFGEWWAYGWFFLGVGLAQVLFAVLLVRGAGTVASVAGIVGNLAVVGIYVLSRTNGLPVGPRPEHGAHQLEGVGVLDITATAVEVGLIMLLVSFLPTRLGRTTVNLLLFAGLGLWALRFSGLLA